MMHLGSFFLGFRYKPDDRISFLRVKASIELVRHQEILYSHVFEGESDCLLSIAGFFSFHACHMHEFI
jgi:hypothetical protein